MAKNKRGNRNDNGSQKKKEKSKHKMPASMIKRGKKREVGDKKSKNSDHCS